MKRKVRVPHPTNTSIEDPVNDMLSEQQQGGLGLEKVEADLPRCNQVEDDDRFAQL